ncbi:TOLIP-like protein [Mya arenaria]|uniref:TOLIP-like protein n=1 Tax=Mya arenaria TaxID=6604 RepID=A0ABY7ED08_MYAAR|nr:TOLIP-like protein [Mya arenaria]
MSSTNNSTAVNDRRSQVMVGELPTDFLRINGTPQQQQAYADERVARVLQAQQSYMPIPANVKGRLNISIVQAKLNKNYGLTRMDPYCRIRVGHAVFETPTSYNGGKNPQWCKDMQCLLPHGVDNMYKSFTTDDRVAWTYITFPAAALNGETVDQWFPLSGKQGDEKEGTLNLILTFTPVQDLPQMMPPVGVPTVMYPNSYVVPQGYPPMMPAQPQGPGYTEENFKQVKDMFPNMEDDIIRSVFAANNGNEDATINALLQMSAD